MHRDKKISLTNKLSYSLIILLIYWVFIFIIINVFGLRVFRENLTETFFTSIMAIIALLGGSVILNVMLNLTKISEALAGKEGTKEESQPKRPGIRLLIFVLSFPIIFGLLYLGDLRTSYLKRDYLLTSAESIVSENRDIIERLGDYSYDLSYLQSLRSALNLLEKQDENFQSLSLIIDDEVQGKEVYLVLRGYYKEELPEKISMIFSCSHEEREYLRKVFSEETTDYRFSSHDGRYELYYPVKTKNRVIVFYFTDYQRYGKIGS